MCPVSTEKKKPWSCIIGGMNPSRLLGLMEPGFQGEAIRTSKLNLNLGVRYLQKKNNVYCMTVQLPFWKGWKRHKDHPQCYLVSPPAHQSRPRLLWIDFLCSRINALSHFPWYSRDCQRYRAEETCKIHLDKF